jgi:hypothetical protein
MSYPLRSIAFVADLIHPPLQHKSEALQRVHSVVFNDEECQYKNFQLMPGGAQLINPPKKNNYVSCCTIMQDRIQVREEMTGIGRDDFRSRVLRIATTAVNNLQIPVFVVRQFVVRSLINTRNYEDTREFIAQSLLKMTAEDFQPLGGDPGLLGLRFAFQTSSIEEGIYNVRIESYTNDARSLFLENVASFRKPITNQNIDDIGADFDTAYSFIESRLIPFVARFDKAP